MPHKNSIPLESTNETDIFFSKSNISYVEKSVIELREGNGQPHQLIEVDDE